MQYAKMIGYGDITLADKYDVQYMYVGEDGERQSMGFTYVCSELLYNPNYIGAIDTQYADLTDPFSVTYLVANKTLLRRWFIERAMLYFTDEPEHIVEMRTTEKIGPATQFKHPSFIN